MVKTEDICVKRWKVSGHRIIDHEGVAQLIHHHILDLVWRLYLGMIDDFWPLRHAICIQDFKIVSATDQELSVLLRHAWKCDFLFHVSACLDQFVGICILEEVCLAHVNEFHDLIVLLYALQHGWQRLFSNRTCGVILIWVFHDVVYNNWLVFSNNVNAYLTTLL